MLFSLRLRPAFDKPFLLSSSAWEVSASADSSREGAGESSSFTDSARASAGGALDWCRLASLLRGSVIIVDNEDSFWVDAGAASLSTGGPGEAMTSLCAQSIRNGHLVRQKEENKLKDISALDNLGN